MNYKTVFLLFIVSAILLLTGCNSENAPYGIRINKNKYPITGIDLSHHSGKIDFEALKKRALDFIIFKVSEGTDFKDKNFEQNYTGAIEQGLTVGFYHFYRFEGNPKQQATFFAQQLEGKKHRLPLVIDVEEWGNTLTKSRIAIIDDIESFIQTLEQLTGQEVMIYTNESGYDTYIKDRFSDYKLWICSFNNPPNINGEWLFWQHAHNGQFEEVEGWVDLNTFNGNRADWEQFMNN